MMNRKYHFCVLCIAWVLALVSCGSKSEDYQETEDGLCYRFYESHPHGAMPQLMDYLKFNMDYYLNDSLIYSSMRQGSQTRIQYKNSQYKGDLLNGFGMMHLGDSASFIVRADSTFHYYFEGEDSTIALKPEDRMRFEVKLLDIQTEEDFRKELDSLLDLRRQAEEAWTEMRARSEQELIDYLKTNGIHDEALYNRVFVIPLRKGDGPKASKGMTAQITYEAYLLDGTYLGSSDSLKGSSYEVTIGQGKVLKGLDEGICHMSKGEKARIVVPYALAYGEQGYGSIPPFTNLLFEVELLDLSVNEQP